MASQFFTDLGNEILNLPSEIDNGITTLSNAITGDFTQTVGAIGGAVDNGITTLGNSAGNLAGTLGGVAGNLAGSLSSSLMMPLMVIGGLGLAFLLLKPK